MATGIQSLINTGSKVWLDSVDPDEVTKNKAIGISGATSNPIIISGLIESGRFDQIMASLITDGISDEDLAWQMTDHLVKNAQDAFRDVWQASKGDDGWVSFELDPLLEDVDNPTPHDEAVTRYIELGKQWNAGHDNRMIKVPATDAGLAALEELAAAGITLNVTLIFSERQYVAARDAIWRGRQRYGQLGSFKSVYSIFISRVDIYTSKQLPDLSDALQGRVGVLNAKQIGIANEAFWADKNLPLKQEMIFASTGKKLDWQEEDYYIAELAGSDILTNPPATNAAIAGLGKAYTASSRTLPDQAIIDEFEQKVAIDKLESTLMAEGTEKFADPQKKLIQTIADKRAELGKG
ncbi:MAG: transaldolase [Phycisphaeraceae bacterium]|nr:transaldolase [Phycisphaeraceae bacterium]